MSGNKTLDDPFDVPEPSFGSLIPDPSATPSPTPPRDPSDFDSFLDVPEPASAGQQTKQDSGEPEQGEEREDPKALAKRLAAEAKARADREAAEAAKEAESTKESAKALAKRLASEAKARADREAAEAAKKEGAKALAKRLAAEAKARADKERAQAKATKARPASSDDSSRLSSVSLPKTSRRKSAAELLEEARKKAAAQPAPSKAQSKPTKKPKRPKQAVAASAVDLSRSASGLVESATLKSEPRPLASDVAFKAVWQAHLARAKASRDLGLAVTATALIAALDRAGPQGLMVCVLTVDGTDHVVWLDAHSGAPIATAAPAATYLPGS